MDVDDDLYHRLIHVCQHPHFHEAFCVYAIMTKISPRVNVGTNKHVDTNE